jgi:hypothetical protein
MVQKKFQFLQCGRDPVVGDDAIVEGEFKSRRLLVPFPGMKIDQERLGSIDSPQPPVKERTWQSSQIESPRDGDL